MKKKIILILCCLSVISLCACNNKPSAEENVTETTESVEEDSAIYKEMKVVVCFDQDGSDELNYEYDEYGRLYKSITISWTDGKPKGYTIYEYDEMDRCVCENRYDANDANAGKREYTYDEKGNCLSDISYNSSGEIVTSDVYEYDDNGNVISHNVIDVTKTETKYEYEYDENGKLLYETKYADIAYKMEYLYNENGELYRINTFWDDVDWGYYEYKYDENGNCIEEISTVEKAELRYEMIYDDNNRMVEKKSYFKSADWVLDLYAGYTYDTDGNLIEVKDLINDSMIEEYSYDITGNLVKENYYYSGELSYYIEYIYDEDGDLLSSYAYDSSGESIGEFEVYEYGYIQVIEE